MATEIEKVTLRDALIVALTEKGIRASDTPPGQLYQDDWFRFYVGHRSLKVLKLGGAIDSLALHDAHHLLTGYGTDVRGEAELVAWELASGGCGRHWVMWVDRVVAIPLMFVAPRASFRAMKSGWTARDLYCLDSGRALDMDLEEARRGVEERSLPAD